MSPSAGTVTLIALVLGAVLSGMGYLFGVWWTQVRVAWAPLVGAGLVGVQFFSPTPGFDAAKLAAALGQARALLVVNTKWSSAQIDTQCLRHAHIYMQPTPAWDYQGERVAGLQAGDVMNVGSDFAALLHETAHMCQELIDSTIDYEHKGWAAAGISRADDEYLEWLQVSPTVAPQ